MQVLIDPQAWAIAAAGGVLIGLASALLLWLNGRVAGISGIFSQVFLGQHPVSERLWRLAFIVGLPLGASAVALLMPLSRPIEMPMNWLGMGLAGVLVGFGTRMANGCTSGHGICGLARFSKRSAVATLSFMASGMLTVFVIRHLV